MIQLVALVWSAMFVYAGLHNDDGWQTIACWSLAVASLAVAALDRRNTR